MFIQHLDLVVSSFEVLEEGELSAAVGDFTEHLVQCVGSSGIWDAWISPQSNLGELGAFTQLTVSAVPDDNNHVLVRVAAAEADKKVGLRAYILSQ